MSEFDSSIEAKVSVSLCRVQCSAGGWEWCASLLLWPDGPHSIDNGSWQSSVGITIWMLSLKPKFIRLKPSPIHTPHICESTSFVIYYNRAHTNVIRQNFSSDLGYGSTFYGSLCFDTLCSDSMFSVPAHHRRPIPTLSALIIFCVLFVCGQKTLNCYLLIKYWFNILWSMAGRKFSADCLPSCICRRSHTRTHAHTHSQWWWVMALAVMYHFVRGKLFLASRHTTPHTSQSTHITIVWLLWYRTVEPESNSSQPQLILFALHPANDAWRVVCFDGSTKGECRHQCRIWRFFYSMLCNCE